MGYASWRKSIIPHRCKLCHRWIESRTNHIVIDIGGWDAIEYIHFCDPHCARMYAIDEREKRQESDKLQEIIFGGEE